MKIRPEQIQRLVDELLASYQAKDLMVAKAREADIRVQVAGIIARNFAEEEAIEEAARKMLASHAGDVRDMDHYKMFMLIKQKLAAKKGFIL